MEYIFHGFNLTHCQMLDRTTVELKINVLRKHVYDCLINQQNDAVFSGLYYMTTAGKSMTSMNE